MCNRNYLHNFYKWMQPATSNYDGIPHGLGKHPWSTKIISNFSLGRWPPHIARYTTACKFTGISVAVLDHAVLNDADVPTVHSIITHERNGHEPTATCPSHHTNPPNEYQGRHFSAPRSRESFRINHNMMQSSSRLCFANIKITHDFILRLRVILACVIPLEKWYQR